MDLQKTYNNILTGGGQLLSNIGKGIGNIYNTVNSNPIGHQVLNTAQQSIQPNPFIRQAIQVPQIQNMAIQSAQHGIGAIGQGIVSANNLRTGQTFINQAQQGQNPYSWQNIISRNQQSLRDLGNVVKGGGYAFAPESAAIGGLFNA